MRGRRSSSIGRRLSIAVACAVVMVLTAPAAFAVERVRASGTSFRPRRVHAAVGERVVWRATSGSHTVTAYRGDWNKDTTLDEGERTSFTFSSAGRYRYQCRFHSTLAEGACDGMCGVVVVG